MSSDERGEPLNLISTEVLWDELSSRYESAIVLGYRDVQEGRGQMMAAYTGDPFRAEGLCREFLRKLACGE